MLGVLWAVPPAPAASPEVLVFGWNDNGTEGNNVALTLESLGYEVERTEELPDDLDVYSAIWYIEAYKGLDSESEAQLQAYVESGGSLYLTGERPCCEELNESGENILRAILTNKSVTVGGLGDIGGPFTFNPHAENEIASRPNTLVDFVPESPGGMAGIGGIDDQNVFASNGQIAVGAVFDERDMITGMGRVVILMDIDWLTSPGRAPIIENIQNFLLRGRGCTNDGPVDDPGFSWRAGPSNCTVLTSPSTVFWSASSSNGGVSFDVAANDVEAECSDTVSAGVTTVTCTLRDAEPTGSLLITASDSVGSVTRRYRVRSKNDPRNVPPGFSSNSNWWEWPDTDEDGVPDYWEEEGVWVHNRYLALPAFGSDPLRKDLFLRYDFEEGEEFSAEVLTNMTETFAEAPISNPDGSTGVSLHIDLGTPVPSSIVGDFKLEKSDIQKVTAYTGFSNSAEIGGGGVPQIFHWMLNFDASSTGAIGEAFINGGYGFTAFPVSSWEAALNVGTTPDAAVAFVEAVNATHELGHQLGLRHRGAGDWPPDDPRYESVMSYAYSNFGVPDGFLGLGHRNDYSRKSSVNFDWRMGSGSGRLTFVSGQWGEEPDFYSRSANEVIDTSRSTPLEMTIAQSLRAAAPESVEGFVESFVPEAAPDIPALADEELTVAAATTVEIPLRGSDPQGSPLTYEIFAAPTLGTATPVPGGIQYKAPSGAGEDTVLVRATNGTFSSEVATVRIHIKGSPVGVAVAGTPVPVGAGAGAATPGHRVKPRKTRCRRGFRAKKVKGKVKCVKRHRKRSSRRAAETQAEGAR